MFTPNIALLTTQTENVIEAKAKNNICKIPFAKTWNRTIQWNILSAINVNHMEPSNFAINITQFSLWKVNEQNQFTFLVFFTFFTFGLLLKIGSEWTAIAWYYCAVKWNFVIYLSKLFSPSLTYFEAILSANSKSEWKQRYEQNSLLKCEAETCFLCQCADFEEWNVQLHAISVLCFLFIGSKVNGNRIILSSTQSFNRSKTTTKSKNLIRFFTLLNTKSTETYSISRNNLEKLWMKLIVLHANIFFSMGVW